MSSRLFFAISFLFLCLVPQPGFADANFQIENIWTTDITGVPKDEFLPGERILCYVDFQILNPVPGTISVYLRAFGDGWNETSAQTIPGGIGRRIVVFGRESPVWVSSNAGEGKVTLRVNLEGEGEPSFIHGRAHTYGKVTCTPGNFPKEYLGNVEVSIQPFDMALTLDDRYLYVTSTQEANITVIDTSLLEVVNIIQNPEEIGQPRGITLNRDGSEMLVCDYLMGKIHVIGTATHQWLEGIPVTNRKGLMEIAFNRIRNELYVTDFANSSLIICNGSTYAFEEEIPLVNFTLGLYGYNPLDLRIDPSGSWAYVLCQSRGSVIKVDLNHRKVVTWNDTPYPQSWGLDLSPDGRTLYVITPNPVGYYSWLYVIKTLDLSILNIFKLGHAVLDLVIRPDGRYAYAVDSFLGELVIIDLASGEVLQACNIMIGYGGMILQPNHQWTRLFVGRWAPGLVDAIGW